MDSGGAEIYERKTDEKLRTIESDGYLADVFQTGDYTVLQFTEEDRGYSGKLLNADGQVLAELPDLCDVKEDKLLFDYSQGAIRESPVYSLNELLKMTER